MKKVLKLLGLMFFTICFLVQARAQENEKITVKGTVISEETKLPLQGASIVIKGNKKGVLTQQDGSFSIKAYKGQDIEISFVGFEKQTIKIKNSETIVISLKLVATESEEVVVVGYGTRKKSHLTGSVAKVVNDNLGQIPVARADEALMGKLSGVNIQITDAQPGAAPTIQIRGATSITAGTGPLIVIDGYPVPTDLSAIDMNDVESIEVLKDAASAAIYGARGGNGVILITSKSGKVGKGRISLNITSGIKDVYRKLHYPTLEEWKQFVLKDNNGILPPTGEIAQAEAFNTNIDWQNIIFRQSNFHNAQLSVSGGTPTMRYMLSGSAMLDDGVQVGNGFNRFSIRAGFTVNASPKLIIDVSLTPSYTLFNNAGISLQEASRSLPPWMPLYQTDSTSKYTGKPVGSPSNPRDYSTSYNPYYTGVTLASASTINGLLELQGITDQTSTVRNLANFSAKYTINPHLTFKSSIGSLVSFINRDTYTASTVNADPIIQGIAFARQTSQATASRTRTFDISNDNILSYKTVIKKNDIDVIAGYALQYNNTDVSYGQAYNFATDAIHTLNAGTLQKLTDTVFEQAIVSYLTRVQYAYDNKYLASASLRYDGNSRFGPDNRYSFFPAASVGWRLSREKFFPDNRIVNDVKLRASFGTTGNDKIGDYRYFANVTPVNTVLGQYPTPGFQLTSFPDSSLKWERTYSSNIGADFGFLNSKITLTVEYYHSITDRLLLNLPIPASTGFSSYYINKGKVSNDGIEFDFTANLITKRDFRWTISGNGAANKNKLLDFGGSNQLINEGDPKRVNYFLTQVGGPLVQFYGYHKDTGHVSLQGTNYWPVGVTSLYDRVKDTNRTTLGTPYPKFTFGFTSNFQYKQFDVSITIQGSLGAKVFNIDPYYNETEFSPTGTIVPLTDTSAAKRPYLKIKTSTDGEDLQDASFYAIRNLNVGYSLPLKMIKKWGFSRIRTFVSAANLYYHFASNYTSYNPEANNGFPTDPLRKGYQRGATPLARTITFGISTDF